MKLYELTKVQQLPIGIKEAWKFFSSPRNLKAITPDHMGFEITNITHQEEMYEGQIIAYKVRPILNIPLRWVTEITHVKEPYYFVDEQRFGPYSFWHHQHIFEENDEGVLMKDIVNYGIPLGPLGRIANTVFVRKQLEGIFDYRLKAVDNLF